MLFFLFRSQFNPQGELGFETRKSGSKIRAFSHSMMPLFDEESKGGASANTGKQEVNERHTQENQQVENIRRRARRAPCDLSLRKYLPSPARVRMRRTRSRPGRGAEPAARGGRLRLSG